MKHQLCGEIEDALNARATWAERQVLFYRMRHHGNRRMAKPYPNAADLHFPLIDSLIERMKPFYFQQLYGTEQFASFVSLQTQAPELTSAVAQWFDYRLKQKSNFEREMMAVIDFLCMYSSRIPLKITWDVEDKYVCFDAIDPMFFIVPDKTVELSDSPWVVHVLQLTKSQYKKNDKFKQDEGFVKSITGRYSSNQNNYWQEKTQREGITYGTGDDMIVLWEIYKQKNGQIQVETYSPMRMDESDAVRDPFTLTYDHNSYPFVGFRTEIKDKGWYSPRGISEKVAAFEDAMCRLWNSEFDFIDFFSKPLWQNDGQFTNTGVVQFLPGSTLPQGIKPAQMPEPPIDLAQTMEEIRATAEYLIGIPDLSGSQHLQGRPGSRGDVTATQIQAIVGQSSMSDDMRARVFRKDAQDVYKMAYSLLYQYDRDSLMYVLNDEQLTIPPAALHSEYQIMPNGSADSWNKPLQLQKAISRKTLFANSPYIRQGELDKSILEIDDPSLIKRLYQQPGDELAAQGEAQAQEISIMLLGWPAAVQKSDDDKTHLQTIQGFIDRRVQTGEPITPEFAILCLQHIQQHDQALVAKKDPQVPQIRQQLAPLNQYLASIAQSAQQTPQNIIPGPGAPPPSGATPGKTQNAPGQDEFQMEKDKQDSATKLMNAFASLIKAGVPVSTEDINAALAQANMPPLQTAPPAAPPPMPAAPTV